MSMGIGNNAASWAQFVRITNDARARTTAPMSSAEQIQKPVPFKQIADMYLSNQNQMKQESQAVSNIGNLNLNHKTVGTMFDAYA